MDLTSLTGLLALLFLLEQHPADAPSLFRHTHGSAWTYHGLYLGHVLVAVVYVAGQAVEGEEVWLSGLSVLLDPWVVACAHD